MIYCRQIDRSYSGRGVNILLSLFLCVQLIAKRTAHDKFPRAASILPKFRTAYLEVITLGVRDLKPHGFQVRYFFPLKGKCVRWDRYVRWD